MSQPSFDWLAETLVGARLFGYIRISAGAQDAQLQNDGLVDAGMDKRDIYADVTSGRKEAASRAGHLDAGAAHDNEEPEY